MFARLFSLVKVALTPTAPDELESLGNPIHTRHKQAAKQPHARKRLTPKGGKGK